MTFGFSLDGDSADEARELLWGQTVYQVIRLLEEAEKRIRAPARLAEYMARKGWWRPSKAVVSKGRRAKVPEETALSEAIVGEIESLQEDIILKTASAPANLFDISELRFSAEVPRKRKKGIGRYAKPTDIRVYKLGSEIIDLRIEAKVLIKDGDLQKAYLSDQGLKRFSDPDEPYTDHEIGGMVAYTINHDRAVWQKKIDDALCASVPAIPISRQHVHGRADETLFCRVLYVPDKGSRKDVLVFHVVLEFDSEPSAR